MPKELGRLVLYTVEDLAELLDAQERTIYNMLRSGKLRGRKMAGRWYVTQAALEEYFGDRPSAAEDEAEPVAAAQGRT